MPEQSTIQSLKAVDAWIDVINANINGGVRTAFKSSRLKFGGTNVDVERAGTSTNLPLQIPESGLATANTVIDFSQGAVTASTENTHLAIQGDGFFLVVDPASMGANGTLNVPTAASKLYVTRDGEFHADANGLLCNNAGYYLVTCSFQVSQFMHWDTAISGAASAMRGVFDDVDNPGPATVATKAIKLSTYLQGALMPAATVLADNVSTLAVGGTDTLLTVPQGNQELQFTPLGSTIYDFGWNFNTGRVSTLLQVSRANLSAQVPTILSKSLEASNASMTQSVPELSLAQKLFSALTKVLQISQTDTDSVLNLVR